MATPEEHAAAVRAVLTAGLAPKFAYDLDEVPSSPRPQEYVEFSVTRRFGGEIREDGTVGTIGTRLVTTYIAKTVTNARVLQSKITAALEGVSLTIGGDTTTGISFETAETIEPTADGYFAGRTDWTYTL